LAYNKDSRPPFIPAHLFYKPNQGHFKYQFPPIKSLQDPNSRPRFKTPIQDSDSRPKTQTQDPDPRPQFQKICAGRAYGMVKMLPFPSLKKAKITKTKAKKMTQDSQSPLSPHKT